MGKASSPSDANPPDLAPCKLCRTPIPVGAKLCWQCNSYQDWRRHLNVSSTVLALLVALVSVLGTALPAIVDALRPNHSQIVLSHPVIRGEAVYVVVSNLGSRPGVIERGQIHSRYLGMDSELALINSAEAFVGPGTKQVGLNIRLRLSPMDSNLRMLNAVSDGIQRPQEQAGKIGLWLQGSDGRATFVELPVSFEDISTLLEAHMERCETAAAPPTINNGCIGIRELEAESDRAHQRLQEALRGVARTQPKQDRRR